VSLQLQKHSNHNNLYSTLIPNMDMESSSTGRTNNTNDISPSPRPVQTVTLEESTPKHQTPLRFKEADKGRSCLAQGLASNYPIARRLIENVHLRSPDFDDMDLSFQSTPRGGGEATPRRDDATSPLGDTATPPVESEQDRRRRQEEEESIALARLLMAQEAMESYALSADYLRYHASQYSQEDMEALQALLAEEEEEASDEAPDTDNYEMMLRLGESIGDVKTDRWRMVANKHMADLPTFCFTEDMAKGLGENDTRRKCQVCQCDYETDETVKTLPCGHCFHSECVDQWLKENDCCAYCRKPILDDKGDANTGTGSM
jgi:Ring finger domain